MRRIASQGEGHQSAGPRLFLPAAAAIACGMLASVFATPYGMGVTPDSLLYLNAADHLAQGHGLRVATADDTLVPLTHYPPLFPAILALFTLGGLSPLGAARAVALGVTALNVALVTTVTFTSTKSATAATAAAFVVALSVDMLFLNTAVWSDGLFIALQVTCLALVSRYLQTSHYGYLLAGAGAAALAWLTRWIGGAVVFAASMSILTLGPGLKRHRLAHSLRFALLASALPAAWVLRNVIVAQTATNRALGFSPLSRDDLAAVVETTSSWLLPGSNRVTVFAGQDAVAAAMLFVAVVGLGVLVHRFVRRTIADRSSLSHTPVVFLLFAICYIVAVLLGAAFYDSAVPLDNRILAPAYVAAIPVVAFILQRSFRANPNRLSRLAGVGAITIFLAIHFLVTVGAGLHFRKEGRGYVGPAWHYPTLRTQIATIEPMTPIFSNHPGAVAFALGRRASGASPDALAGAATRGRAVLVYFDNPRQHAPRSPQATRLAPSTAEYRIELLRGLSATLVARERNAWLYDIRGTRP